jgi:hypothetical protein
MVVHIPLPWSDGGVVSKPINLYLRLRYERPLKPFPFTCLSFMSSLRYDSSSLIHHVRQINQTMTVKGTDTTQYIQKCLDAIRVFGGSGLQSKNVMLNSV